MNYRLVFNSDILWMCMVVNSLIFCVACGWWSVRSSMEMQSQERHQWRGKLNEFIIVPDYRRDAPANRKTGNNSSAATQWM